MMASRRLETTLNLILALLLLVLFLTAALLIYQRERGLVQRIAVDNARNIARQIIETRDYMSSVVKGEPATNPDLIPQVVATRVAKRLTQGSRYSVRQVSLRYRNPENSPDDYEAAQLRSFSSRKVTESYNMVAAGHDKTFRYMLPMVAEQSCLECHGLYEKAPAFVQKRFPKGHFSYNYSVGDIIGAVSVSIPLSELYREIGTNFRSDLVFWGLVLLVILAVTGFVVRRHIISPITTLAETMDRVSLSGDFTTRLTAAASNEIGRLMAAFNRLMEELQHRTSQFQETGERYRNLIEIAQSAIITFLPDGRIVTANRQAGHLFGAPPDELLGDNLFDHVADVRELKEHVEMVLRDGRCGGPQYGLPVLFRSLKGDECHLELALSASESEGQHLITAIMREARVTP
jgi:PAS domain S-box-containing protein